MHRIKKIATVNQVDITLPSHAKMPYRICVFAVRKFSEALRFSCIRQKYFTFPMEFKSFRKLCFLAYQLERWSIETSE